MGRNYLQRIGRMERRHGLLTVRLGRHFPLTAEEINQLQDWGHDDPIFLLAPVAKLESLPDFIPGHPMDRANLLHYVDAVFEFGIEEAVLEIAFTSHAGSFLEILHYQAQSHGHTCAESKVPFVSHWVIANQRATERRKATIITKFRAKIRNILKSWSFF